MQADVAAFQRFMAGFVGRHPDWFGLSGMERAAGEREERQGEAPAVVVAPVEKPLAYAQGFPVTEELEIDWAEEVCDEEAEAEEAAAVLIDD